MIIAVDDFDMVDVVFDNRSTMNAILILDFVPFLSEKDPTDIDSFVGCLKD